MSKERIGILGGTFDPPHVGHLILAAEAHDQLNLSKLLWVLTPVSPFKNKYRLTPLENRLAMLQAAIAGNPDFELSRVEIDHPGPYYSVDTIHRLANQHPSADLVLIIGGDSLYDLPHWHQAADLVHACSEIGVMRRPGDSLDLSLLAEQLPGIRENIHFIDAPLLEIASRDIRRRAQQGQPFRYYLLPSVYDYIVKTGLYQANNEG